MAMLPMNEAELPWLEESSMVVIDLEGCGPSQPFVVAQAFRRSRE